MDQQRQPGKRQHWLWKGLWTTILMGLVCLAATPAWGDPGLPDQPSTSGGIEPAQLFEIHCAGCHPNGGNIIRRGKTLQAKALKRYGYSDTAAIATIIANGKGVMSAYQDRFTADEIDALANYVGQQAEGGWS